MSADLSTMPVHALNRYFALLPPMWLLIFLGLLMNLPVAQAQAKQQVNVAYFLGWPTPGQKAQLEKTFDAQMGLTLNWVALETGVEMTEAMQRGKVDIAYAQGVVPFVVAVSEGVPISTIGIAMSYSDNDNCVVHQDAGITKQNAQLLEGKNVAVAVGTVPHFKMIRQLIHLGVDYTKLKIHDLPTSDAARALALGNVTMACGFGGGFREMLEYGDVLMTPQELAEIGIHAFDIISVTDQFARDHPEMLTAFLQVLEDSNNAYRQEPETFYAALAEASQQSEQQVKTQLTHFAFPSKDEMLIKWFNGNVSQYYQDIATTYKDFGRISHVLDDYSQTINITFLEQVR